MYYLELINRFWNFNQRAHLRPTAIAMYLYLLKIGYEKGCYGFNISDIVISEDLGLTRPTIISTKIQLKSLGLIDFQTKNGFACYYRLILNYPIVSEQKIVEKKVIEKERLTQNAEKLSIPPKGVYPNHHFSEKTDQEIKVQPIPAPAATDKGNIENQPTMAEFIEYARTLDFYEPQMDVNIKEKYESWTNSNWKNSANRPITNWRSSLKSTLPFMKNNTEDKTILLQTIPNIKRPKTSNDNTRM